MLHTYYTPTAQSYLLVILIIFVGISCSANTDKEIAGQSEKRDLNFKKVLEVGNTSDRESDAPLLSFAANVATDSKGNIFLFDSGASKIFVYDKRGEYQHAIGREGSGPGEIGQLTTIYVDSKDRLITADRENTRITVYNTAGEVLNSRSALGINHVRDIREMPDEGYLLTGWDGDHFMHITDPKFENKISSFGSISDFEEDRENPESRWLQRMAGFAKPISDTRIVFTPLYYQGSIYLYEETDTSLWELQNSFSGYQTIETPVTFTSKEPDSYHGVSFGPDGRMYIANKTLSLGFYQHKDDLIHLSRLNNKDSSIAFILERFDFQDLELQHYYISDSLKLGGSYRRNIRWMDNQNRLFVADNADIPKIEVLQIQK